MKGIMRRARDDDEQPKKRQRFAAATVEWTQTTEDSFSYTFDTKKMKRESTHKVLYETLPIVDEEVDEERPKEKEVKKKKATRKVAEPKEESEDSDGSEGKRVRKVEQRRAAAAANKKIKDAAAAIIMPEEKSEHEKTPDERSDDMYTMLSNLLRDREPRRRVVPDIYLIDSTLVREVYESAEKETVEDWRKRAESVKINNQYSVDYIIAVEHCRSLSNVSFMRSGGWRGLIKWSGFPIPTWDLLSTMKGPVASEFVLRTLYFDCVELDIRKKYGDAYFSQHFPHRYLEFELGSTEEGYVENKRSLYHGRMRAIEHKCTTINAKQGRSPLYIADWTDLPEDDGTLMKTLVFCDAQCLLQRGNSAALLLFRFPEKGWTFRCLSEFDRHKPIAEGFHERAKPAHPPVESDKLVNDGGLMLLDLDKSREDGPELTSKSTSSRKDTDLRLVQQMCEPTFYYEERVVFGNDGSAKDQVAIQANRQLKRGEEIGIDFHAGRLFKDLYKEMGEEAFKLFPETGCQCISPECRFPQELLDSFRTMPAKKVAVEQEEDPFVYVNPFQGFADEEEMARGLPSPDNDDNDFHEETEDDGNSHDGDDPFEQGLMGRYPDPPILYDDAPLESPNSDEEDWLMTAQGARRSTGEPDLLLL